MRARVRLEVLTTLLPWRILRVHATPGDLAGMDGEMVSDGSDGVLDTLDRTTWYHWINQVTMLSKQGFRGVDAGARAAHSLLIFLSLLRSLCASSTSIGLPPIPSSLAYRRVRRDYRLGSRGAGSRRATMAVVLLS
jgi:hypothetical protein